MTEFHPYKPWFDCNTKIIIVGTTPPMRFTQKHELFDSDVDFYYGSRDNYFWDIIGDVFGVEFERKNTNSAILQRQEFLKQSGIGLVDIVLEFSRMENNASDNNLNVTKFQNIYQILKDNHQIQKIYFTGFSGPNSAESLTSKHLAEHKVYNTIISSDTPKHKIFKIDNRVVNSYSLYSPSPAARKKYEVILSLYRMLRND